MHVAEWQARVVTEKGESIRINVRLLRRHPSYGRSFKEQIAIIKKFIADRLSPGS